VSAVLSWLRRKPATKRAVAPPVPPFRRKLLFETLEPRVLLSASPGLEPLVFIPGFAATQAESPAHFAEWLTTRGITPDKL
jgi:hypothetical protein